MSAPLDCLPTLEAPRLRLRQLETGDVDALYAVYSNAEVMRYWSRGPFSDRRDAEELLERSRANLVDAQAFQWGIALNDDDVVIGTCSLFGIDWEHRRAALGYVLARSAWGHGYAYEAVGGLLQFAIEHLRLARFEADIDPDNLASRRLAEKLGFVHEGTLRERWRVGDGVQDSVMYGLLAREFVALG